MEVISYWIVVISEYYSIFILCLLANITPADKCPRFFIPAQAGIKQSIGCRTKSGMTAEAFESPG